MNARVIKAELFRAFLFPSREVRESLHFCFRIWSCGNTQITYERIPNGRHGRIRQSFGITTFFLAWVLTAFARWSSLSLSLSLSRTLLDQVLSSCIFHAGKIMPLHTILYNIQALLSISAILNLLTPICHNPYFLGNSLNVMQSLSGPHCSQAIIHSLWEL
jgi:hypothetical protein